MEIIQKRRSGRPRKPEEEKVHYQRIAVYLEDYQKLVNILTRRNENLVDAFTQMVDDYAKKNR